MKSVQSDEGLQHLEMGGKTEHGLSCVIQSCRFAPEDRHKESQVLREQPESEDQKSTRRPSNARGEQKWPYGIVY